MAAYLLQSLLTTVQTETKSKREGTGRTNEITGYKEIRVYKDVQANHVRVYMRSLEMTIMMS